MAEKTQSAISIKGIREGILVTLGEGDFEELLATLGSELATKKGFLSGSRIALNVGRRDLSRQKLVDVQELLAGHGLELWTVLAKRESTMQAARDLGLATRLSGSNVDLDGHVMRSSPSNGTGPAATESATEVSAEISGSNTLLLRETLRSGRSVYHEGHVVVIGDVNPGAEIVAGGDVVVWGRLRGLVHAGAYGDTSAVICALELIPTQLRIADQIAISPRETQRQSTPEMVSISEGHIVAEAWPAKR
jgi:septum site-determining protein MinC